MRFKQKLTEINEGYAQKFGKMWLPSDHSGIKEKKIKEVPILMMKDGTIVCIPKLPEMGIISAIGMTGFGKTLICGYIIDNIFYSWEDNLGVINDSQEESISWSEANNVEEFIARLRSVNQRPVPLPMLYLFPNSNTFEENPKKYNDKNSCTISIPSDEVLENIEKYVKLGGSEKYLIEKKEELLSAQTEEELFEEIDSINTGTKGMAETVRKIKAEFKNLIKEGILNISNPSIPAYLTIKKKNKDIYSGNPFTAIMHSNCIPAFITSDLYTQKHKDAIFSYYIDSLFYESAKGSMEGKRVWLYFDELTKVVHSNPQLSSPETERALTNIAARGRNNGISLIYATQGYNEIPQGIRSQTKYAIVFRHKSAEECKMIKNDFGLTKATKEDILKLKKYEAIAMTIEHFVCYNQDKKWEASGPFKGTILPPLHLNRFLQKK